ncbi:MAG: hypothetical protein ACLQM8_20565 [Limisphaerales bacterium]
MKKSTLFGLSVLAVGSLLAAEPTPKEAVTKAAKKLGESANYAWKSVVVVPEDAQFKPGPTEGKTEKDGFSCFTMSFFDNKVQVVAKGEQRAVTDQDGNWQSVADLDKEEGPGRFLGMIARNLKTPAKEAADIAGFAKDLKLEGGVYSSDLTEEGAKTLQTFGPRGGDQGPTVSDAKGSVKFWLKEGALVKYEFKLKGAIKFGDNEFPNDRTTTVEIKDVGATKAEAPEAAKKKLS